MRFLQLVFAAFVVLTITNHCTAKAWRGIVPLKSTRVDVERLLGPPTGDLPTYYLSDSTVDFQYAKCRCGDKCKMDGWNVPPDTVTVIRVGMKGVVKLADLKINLTHFKRWQSDEDVPGSYIYKNEEDGFAIEVGGEYVSALIYTAREADDRLRCPRKSNRGRGSKPNCLPIPVSIECSSELIRAGDAVECEANLNLPGNTPPIVNWKVPRGILVRRVSPLKVMVMLTATRHEKITVVARVVSPNICFDEASVVLVKTKAPPSKRH